MAGSNGYPLEWFVVPVEDRLKCGICKQVMRDPTTTPCGHTYCSQCISSWTGLYGVCPERCREVEPNSLSPLNNKMGKFISGLSVHCKNRPAGCRIQIRLAEKQQHEQVCSYRRTGLGKSLHKHSLSQQDLFSISSASQDSKFKFHHKRSESASGLRVHTIPRRAPSTASSCKPPGASTMPVAMNSKGTYTIHVFRLKRTKTKEPLGLVLVSGQKTSAGTPVDFHVKNVHKDTLGWKAGVQADDRIVQVDHHDITSIGPQEAVARIKEKTLVTLTIHRGAAIRADQDQHVYDEIFYSDLSQQSQDENMPQIHTSTYHQEKGRGAARMLGEMAQRSNRHPSNSSVATGSGRHAKPMHRVVHQTNPSQQQGTLERGSKDSGLSSGSSTHQEHDDRFALRPEPPHHVGGSQESQGSHGSQCSGDGRSRLEGNYEVEDIYLQKNGTSQLGITLGYDTKSSSGKLIVCEILPSGLAALNGRLKSGDRIRRVNGFEVHDPEEAILMFLEQDQDITLTVARPVKVSHNGSSTHLHPGLATPPHPDSPRNVSPSNHDENSYALLEDSVQFRRVDSCGVLDSRRQPSPVMGGKGVGYDQPHHFPPSSSSSSSQVGGEKMRRTKSASATSKPPRRRDVLKSRSPPARQPSPLVTESQQPVYQVLQQPKSPQEQGKAAPSPRPVYHVLQQPGSPQEPARPEYQVLQHPGSPQEPEYQVLHQPGGSQEQSQPEYHVLQQPRSPAPPTSQPEYHVLQQPRSPATPTSQPEYHVLQQPRSPAPPTSQPEYHVLQQPRRSAPSSQPEYNVLQQARSPPPPSSSSQPEYQVLQQPSSPQDPTSSSSSSPPPMYHVLSDSPKHSGNSQAPPTYHVLQQTKEPLPYKHPPKYQPPVYQVLQQPDNTLSSSSSFQQEEIKIISQAGNNACRARGKGGLSKNTNNSSNHQFPKHQIIVEAEEGNTMPPSPESMV